MGNKGGKLEADETETPDTAMPMSFLAHEALVTPDKRTETLVIAIRPEPVKETEIRQSYWSPLPGGAEWRPVLVNMAEVRSGLLRRISVSEDKTTVKYLIEETNPSDPLYGNRSPQYWVVTRGLGVRQFVYTIPGVIYKIDRKKSKVWYYKWTPDKGGVRVETSVDSIRNATGGIDLEIKKGFGFAYPDLHDLFDQLEKADTDQDDEETTADTIKERVSQIDLANELESETFNRATKKGQRFRVDRLMGSPLDQMTTETQFVGLDIGYRQQIVQYRLELQKRQQAMVASTPSSIATQAIVSSVRQSKRALSDILAGQDVS